MPAPPATTANPCAAPGNPGGAPGNPGGAPGNPGGARPATANSSLAICKPGGTFAAASASGLRRALGQRLWSAALAAGVALLLGGCALPGRIHLLADMDLPDPRARIYFEKADLVNEGAWNFDFAVWREDFTFTPQYRPTNDDDPFFARLINTANDKDFRGCHKQVRQGLLANYVSILLHNYAAYCLDNLGRESEANYHRVVLHRLLYSIIDSGAGDSPSHPQRFISQREMLHFYTVLGYSVLASEISEAPPEDLGIDCAAVNCSTLLLLQLQVLDKANGRRFERWADLSMANAWLHRLQAAPQAAPSG